MQPVLSLSSPSSSSSAPPSNPISALVSSFWKYLWPSPSSSSIKIPKATILNPLPEPAKTDKEKSPVLYREGLKSLEITKEAAQIFVSGANGFAQSQSASEDQKFIAKPTQDKPDSSITNGISKKPIASALEIIHIHSPAPPTFKPYTIKVGLSFDNAKEFEVNTLEQEEAMLEELEKLLEKTESTLSLYGDPLLLNKEFAEIMKDCRPYHLRVYQAFESRFEIYNKNHQKSIGLKIAKEEDLENGLTKVTYQNGKIENTLQPYSASRHPWAKKSLEDGLFLPPNSVEQLRKFMPKIIHGKNYSNKIKGLHFFCGASTVFSLDTIPGIVFKRSGGNEGTRERFEKMVQAEYIRQALNLDLLVVPHAKLIEIAYKGTPYLLIAEERLDVNADHSAQEDCYRKYTIGMNDLVKELILFIQHAGLSDISWRNIPLLNNHAAKVGLIDLEHINHSAIAGLLGTGKSPDRGLLSCLFSEEQINAVVDAARPYDIHHEAAKMREDRLKELEKEERLHKFHAEKGLRQNPRRAIDIENWTQEDWQKLELDLNETDEIFDGADPNAEWKEISLKDAVVDVVMFINQAIQEAPAEASLIGARRVSFNLDNCQLAGKGRKNKEKRKRLGRIVDYGKSLGVPKNLKVAYLELRTKHSWLARIAKALVQGGHLFYFEVNKFGDTYLLQA